MLEDLFKMVKDRFNEEQKEEADSSALEIPKDLLFKCPRCQNVFYMDEFEKRKKTCPVCNYHARLSAKERLDITVDKDSFKPFDENMVSLNPIGFPDYEKKIKSMQESTGLKDAVVTGECTIRGYRAVIGIMDSNFMMASMGSVVGEKITRAFEYATEHKLPYADGKDKRCGKTSQRCRRTLYHGAYRPHNRRCYSVLCKSWRYNPCRA